MSRGRKARGGAAGTTGQKPRPSGKNASPGNANSQESPQAQCKTAITLSHEQIAQRAVHIWRQGGCLPGRDEQNWKEAEAQLKAELGTS
jgi:Protein of unknown function (DUF2934)